jgi:hypothetical protein
MIGWLKLKISCIYSFFCKEILQRREFFTPQLTRLMVHHGVFYWMVTYIVIGFCFYNLFVIGGFWRCFFSFWVLFFMAWLSDHLVDYSNKHPENEVM